MSKKILLRNNPTYNVKKKTFGPCNYILSKGDEKHHILILNVNRNTILSINSKHIWEIKRGKANGVNFKTHRHELIDMREFNQYENKIVVFKNKPHKILKYLNENQLLDISDLKEINNIKIFNSIEEINV